MPLRALLRYLLQNDQIVQKLSESYPIRRAAQMTAYVFHRGKDLGHEGLEKLQEADIVNKMRDEASKTGQKLGSMKESFTKDVKEGLKEINEQYKKNSK
ncbi:hypothetical protein SNE40_009496 [Patella caerulea]|uniref:Uncharacterized protein n=1 Tax=Patella caerulea TaxID=87958 RepID=A0AAN8JTL6_PATCE